MSKNRKNRKNKMITINDEEYQKYISALKDERPTVVVTKEK